MPKQQDMTKNQWWTDRQVAEFFNVSRPTIWKWAKVLDGFPKPHKFGHTTRFSADAVRAYQGTGTTA
ncbi:MAG: helix-turn-helix domain-containing protein [Shimia thalassica]|uniref:helix-turn-helix transcriptional regulator n=1 Tax=Shimia thalassica TaxID=1715693 RepID=UPI0032976A34